MASCPSGAFERVSFQIQDFIGAGVRIFEIALTTVRLQFALRGSIGNGNVQTQAGEHCACSTGVPANLSCSINPNRILGRLDSR
jgi:hypothetical protein